MKINEIFITILKAIFITILPTIEVIFSLLERINNLKTYTMDTNLTFSIISILGTFSVVFYLLYQYEKVKKDMNFQFKYFLLTSKILKSRAKNLFVKIGYLGVEYYKLSDETDEQFFARIPEGHYKQYIQGEYKELKEYARTLFKEEKVKDIDEIVNLIYGVNQNEKQS
ncbi:MAG: hypothetical protein WC223_12190 [Bacteroidales bacterium]|jgi:hypothetical protein